MTHTPAPWSFKPSTHGDYNILDSDGLATACCIQNGFRHPHETSKNANLIAAAPEMLEALEGIVRSFHESVRTDENISEFPSLEKCIHAINKAKGENNE